MRWKMERRSTNLEDRRGMRPGGLAVGGVGSILVIVIAMLLGADPRDLLQQGGGVDVPAGTEVVSSPAEEELKEFTAVVLAETEDVWHQEFSTIGREYREPTLVLFTEAVESACGMAGSAVGPFYCGGDEKVYLDLSFFDEMRQRFGAPGDFAQAYVIAHEVGHHVQRLLGTAERVAATQEGMTESERRALSVRVELQADFYAGVWAHYTDRMKHLVEAGDIDEALRAASAIGDDRLQLETQGRIVPDSFTHGTSEQRVRWFRRGYETGDMSQGDTFSTRSL